MWKISKLVKKGDYVYAVVKDHPKRTKKNYILLHRILMENYLKRQLDTNEVVHHIDFNKLNNKLSNLELMLNAEHSRLHARKNKRKYVKLKCPWCDKEFDLPHSKSFLSKKYKYPCTCCSNTCRGKLYSFIQNNGVTKSISEKISTSLLEEFKK